MDQRIPLRFDEGLGYYIHQLMYAMRQLLAAQCSTSGFSITAEELAVLMIVSQCEDRDGMTQKQIAETLAKDKAVMTRLLNSLEKHGLIRRAADESDRRVMRISLSSRGDEAVAALKPQLIALLQQVYDGISEDEFLQTRSVLQRLLGNIKKIS